MDVGLLFCDFLFKSTVNSLSPLSLREVIFSPQVRSLVRAMSSIIITRRSVPNTLHIGRVSRAGTCFCSGFIEAEVC